MTRSADPTVTLPPCPPGGVPAVEDLQGAIADWVFAPAMARLVEMFGGEPPAGPIENALAWLDAFSARTWDFRGGNERRDARQVSHPPSVEAVVRDSAWALGLAGRQLPPTAGYDYVLVLGGGPATCLARARHAVGLLDRCDPAAGIVGLGSLRPLTDTEQAAGVRLGLPDMSTEADAMAAVLGRTFPPEHADDGFPARGDQRCDGDRGGEPWWVRGYRSGGRTVHVLAAPSTRPGERANTADTLAGWASLVNRPTDADRVLLVTTDLFVPFQHCEAVRVLGLPYRCGVDTVGLDPSTVEWLIPTTTGMVLQEIRSAIRSMRALYAAVRR